VTFAGTPSTTAPDGNAAATPAVSGATGNGAGGVTYMCASSSATVASLGVQPADCATFVASLPTTWGCCNSASAVGVHGATCVVGVPAAGLGEPGPTLTLPDQGVSILVQEWSQLEHQQLPRHLRAVRAHPRLRCDGHHVRLHGGQGEHRWN
jgi:hypothetical protein